MSEFLFFKVKGEMCELYHGENKLHFILMMKSALY
jgi:hypothetical protein